MPQSWWGWNMPLRLKGHRQVAAFGAILKLNGGNGWRSGHDHTGRKLSASK
jgi:hypothetical protein